MVLLLNILKTEQDDFGKNVVHLKVGMRIKLKDLLFSFVDILYERSYEEDFKRGSFRLKGDTRLCLWN